MNIQRRSVAAWHKSPITKINSLVAEKKKKYGVLHRHYNHRGGAYNVFIVHLYMHPRRRVEVNDEKHDSGFNTN
jgi:hypothetical protein